MAERKPLVINGTTGEPEELQAGDTLPVSAHNDTTSLNAGDYQHLTAAQATGLTDGGSTTLHIHPTPNLQPTMITNSGFGVCSQSTIQNNGSDLVSNGSFPTDTAGWTAMGSATLASIAGGNSGNCLRITNGTTTAGIATQGVTTVPGHVYKAAGHQKNGSIGGSLCIGTTAGGYDLSNVYYYNANWAAISAYFVATGTTTYITLYNGNALNGATTLLDDISVYEIYPGFTAADTKCFDRWTKTSGVQCWREPNGVNTKGGSYYAAKVTGDGSAGTIQWSDGGQAALPQWYSRFADRSMVLGCWVKCSSANKARIGLVQSSGTTWSSYHSGGGAYEWLEVSVAIASNTTTFSIVLDAGTSTTAYFSQPMLNYGTILGSGCYVPIPQELIWFDSKANTTGIYEGVATSSVADTLYSMETQYNLKVPKTAKTLKAYINMADSGSAAGNCYIHFCPAASYAGPYVIYGCSGITNSKQSVALLDVALGPSATVYSSIVASGSNTASVYVRIMGVQL